MNDLMADMGLTPIPSWMRPAAPKKPDPLLHYSSMALEVLQSKLDAYERLPAPVAEAHELPSQIVCVDVAGVTWRCVVSFDEDDGTCYVYYVQIGTAWAVADDVLREDVLRKIERAAEDQQDEDARDAW